MMKADQTSPENLHIPPRLRDQECAGFPPDSSTPLVGISPSHLPASMLSSSLRLLVSKTRPNAKHDRSVPWQ